MWRAVVPPAVDELIVEALADGPCSLEELLRRLNLDDRYRPRHSEPFAFGTVAPALLRGIEAGIVEAQSADGSPLGHLSANVWDCRFGLRTNR